MLAGLAVGTRTDEEQPCGESSAGREKERAPHQRAWRSPPTAGTTAFVLEGAPDNSRRSQGQAQAISVRFRECDLRGPSLSHYNPMGLLRVRPNLHLSRWFWVGRDRCVRSVKDDRDAARCRSPAPERGKCGPSRREAARGARSASRCRLRDRPRWSGHALQSGLRGLAGRRPVAQHDRWCVTWKLFTPDGENLPMRSARWRLAIRATDSPRHRRH
jgi:hypothetical protein